ncbi:MAG: hypothetical protein OXL97_09775 [Chloroflexota bacterium]|nr:hypothetical protein [Chloroflexota bacterium]MDE2884806.1 hypothetical protein [Chloroflexota bacterium]
MTTGPADDERQHIDLGDAIDQMGTELSDDFDAVIRELRIIKAIHLGIFGTVFVAASKYVIGW